MTGKRVFTFNCDSIMVIGPQRVFSDKFFQLETPTQSIICDKKGTKIFDMPGVKIIHTTEIIENGQNVFVAVKNGMQGLIALNQEVLIPFKFDRLVDWTTLESHYDELQYSYKRNYLEATYEGKKTVISRTGEILIPPIEGDFQISSNSSENWKNNRISISTNKSIGLYGTIDTLGNIISYPKWEAIFFFNKEYYIGQNFGDPFQMFRIGQKEPVHEFKSISIVNYVDSLLFCQLNEKWFILNTKTSTISINYFNDIEDIGFYCNMSVVTLDGKKGIIDKRGNYIIEPIYEELERRLACVGGEYHDKNGQEYAAKLNGKWGGIGTKGKKITDFIFDSADDVWKSDGVFYRSNN